MGALEDSKGLHGVVLEFTVETAGSPPLFHPSSGSSRLDQLPHQACGPKWFPCSWWCCCCSGSVRSLAASACRARGTWLQSRSNNIRFFMPCCEASCAEHLKVHAARAACSALRRLIVQRADLMAVRCIRSCWCRRSTLSSLPWLEPCESTCNDHKLIVLRYISSEKRQEVPWKRRQGSI